ncbi:MAG: disulfide bond formation protein B [Rhodospirillales bacterium]|nr:disulfide bond formation protein B [Rhodospirillales bacterium]
MSMPSRPFPWHQPVVLVLAASILVVGTAVASQYIGGLEPCILCYYQRYPWYAVIGIAILALVVSNRTAVDRPRAALLGLCALVFVVGTGIAVYHVGVEHKVFEGPAACGSVTITGQSIDALRAQLVGKPVVRCDQPAWTLFGVSMAGYNLVASVAMALLSGLFARRAWTGRP